jgi:Alw26I/Eco31I/Esp3I family type II restriction endonuclease
MLASEYASAKGESSTLADLTFGAQPMAASPRIDSNPAIYGSKGQNWHSDFVAYMVAIVSHPTYAGMPDAVKPDGKIQWEAPSNRKGGEYQFTHQKRRDWWAKKATALGISPESDQWISQTAKRIHPFGKKPCKFCGKVMRIAYCYPNRRLLRRFVRLFPDYTIDALMDITSIITDIHKQYGTPSFARFNNLFPVKDLKIPLGLDSLSPWTDWIERVLIPLEPSLLSPGAMSNAPDRFDGFHSFNLCCRGKADTGRHNDNMRSYTTDRRVFEYWSDGNWVAADRMMGLVSSIFRDCACLDGGDGPATADHIGPLSLGFCHMPVFRLLSKAANSAKNNRMTKADVDWLICAELRGDIVASWHSEALWNLRKTSVHSDENALRLSKLMRDGQRNAMFMLSKFYSAGTYSFLASLLHLEHSQYEYEFKNPRVEESVTVYDGIEDHSRLTKYAIEQMARRIRIGFEAMSSYSDKDNRHRYQMFGDSEYLILEKAIKALLARAELRITDTTIKELETAE